MAIQNLLDDVIVFDAPREPEMGDELQELLELDAVRDQGGCNVIIDFSEVDIVRQVNLSKLLRLRKIIADNHKKLILCSMAPATKGIFTITGLDEIFSVEEDKSIALARLQEP